MGTGDELIVVGGIAQTRAALLAAHQPTLVGTSCRECGYVYGEVRTCPAAAEALEGCSSLVAAAPVDPVEIVHVVSGSRRCGSGVRSLLRLAAVMALAVVQPVVVVEVLPGLPVALRLVVLAAVLAGTACVWCLAGAVRWDARRERAARRGDPLEPLV